MLSRLSLVLTILILPVFGFSSTLLINQKDALKLLKTDQAIFIKVTEDHHKNHVVIAGSFLILRSELEDDEGRLRPMSTIKKSIDQKGIDLTKPIILYDNGSYKNAGAFYWILSNMGVKNISILIGGQEEWVSKYSKYVAETSVESGEITNKIETEEFPLLASRSQMKTGLMKFETAVVGAFESNRNSWSPSGAINIYYYSFKDPMGDLMTLEGITSVFKEYGLEDYQNIIIFSNGWHEGALLYTLLHNAGYDNVILYPGSESDWQNKESIL